MTTFSEPRDQHRDDTRPSSCCPACRHDDGCSWNACPCHRPPVRRNPAVGFVGVGYTRGSATSKAAAESVATRLTDLQRRALEEFRIARSNGLTYCDLMAKGFTQSSAATRMTELRRFGLIVETNQTRPTPRGGKAKVCVAKEFA